MKYIKSPLNYTGGKYKLLNSLFDIFPNNINTFVDLFAGGFNVGINVNANKIICNDQINYLIELYEFLEKSNTEEVINNIYKIINEFQLSKSNADGYNKLRERYNENKDILDFLVLTFYAFNHQIRFNNSQKFNTPFGKERSSYNDSIEKNLKEFCKALKEKNVPNDFTEKIILKSKYLRVEHIGNMNKLKDTINYVYKEIIPKNNILVENRQFVYFEKYDYKFHWNREDSVIEIYIPIK